MPSPPIDTERCDLPETTCDDDSYDSEEEQFHLFDEELEKGGGFEIDFSKFRYFFNWQALDMDDSTMVNEPQTNRDLMAMLSKHALAKHNADNGTSLEVDKILSANFHPSAGVTYYISFQVSDPSDANHQTKPYRAVVRYGTGDIDVRSCEPKPPSS